MQHDKYCKSFREIQKILESLKQLELQRMVHTIETNKASSDVHEFGDILQLLKAARLDGESRPFASGHTLTITKAVSMRTISQDYNGLP